ncbi:hypothetical protein BX589_1014 [Paraburkholderia fungorum]|jgi:hypothetical protein|uniref:hypothetical protein n=1 Tax=Paraburkholderia fungorum TaxID=134537 RepID=UPI000D06C6E0|nr:hypothetical protein [Paraburkholderia fungorum]PRZ56354.1 hypothetical protein BX589_1014 [Paraburkholderia fungorum]
MSNDREEDSLELIDETRSPHKTLSQQQIRRKPASKRSAVNEFQARTLALLTETLESAALRHFGVPGRERLHTERHKEFTALPEYRLFVEGAYACGFVCTDFAPGGPTIDSAERPEDAVDSWTFFELRHHVHTLLRAERWADGYSSPIFEALAQGVLSAISGRLVSDDTLYEPH